MSDRRQIFELQQRRQVCARIEELKSNCHNLTQARDDMLNRLTRLNEIVDLLFEEKKQNRYDPNIKFDDLVNDQRPPNFAKNDLTNEPNNTLHDANPIAGASGSFKVKLSNCLQEVVQKAEDISKLSDQL